MLSSYSSSSFLTPAPTATSSGVLPVLLATRARARERASKRHVSATTAGQPTTNKPKPHALVLGVLGSSLQQGLHHLHRPCRCRNMLAHTKHTFTHHESHCLRCQHHVSHATYECSVASRVANNNVCTFRDQRLHNGNLQMNTHAHTVSHIPVEHTTQLCEASRVHCWQPCA